jgi:hypothetical protein
MWLCQQRRRSKWPPDSGVGGLYDFTDALGAHNPGDNVMVSVMRGEENQARPEG